MPKAAVQDWVLIPSNARRRYLDLLAKQPGMIAGTVRHEPFRAGTGGRRGVAVSGMGRAYFDQLALEHPEPEPPCRAWKWPPTRWTRLWSRPSSPRLDEVFVFEEDYPVLEERLTFRGPGRSTDDWTARSPRTGELTPRLLKNALGLVAVEGQAAIYLDLPLRAPQFCDGCGHVDAYEALQ